MSKKSSVDSDNYYLYPEWFEGGNQSNQSQPSTSSYSYPTLEYIWSNAVRLTRTIHSNLQDEIEYIEANLGSGGNESCNCSELQYGIDKNSTKIYYNSVNITSNANKIENLSTIKLSRDGSQSMTGLLKCESGLETNTITSYSGDIIECTDNLKLDGDIVGDSTDGLNLIAEDTAVASRIQLTPGSNSKILLGTFSGQSIIPRIEIPEGSGNVNITIRGAHLIPYIDNDQDLGASDKRWKEVYAVKNIVSYIQVLSRIFSNSTLKIGHGTAAGDLTRLVFTPTDISLGTPNSENTLTYRVTLTGGEDNSMVYIKQAHLLPYTSSSLYLGSSAHRWAGVYADKGYFSDTILPDAILLNSANITSNADKIENLSTIKLSRDGAQTMTGLLKCESGLKTNDITTLSGSELAIAGGTPSSEKSQIKLTDDKLSLLTADSNGVLTERFYILGGFDTTIVYMKDADFAPLHDDLHNLGFGFLRWKEICGYLGNFSSIEVKSHIWSNNTFSIGYGTSSTKDSQIRFTSNDLTLMTPNSNGTSTERISLTGNADRSIVYIKNAHLLPYDNLSSCLGSSVHRWVEVFADRGSFVEIEGKNNLKLAGGDPSVGHAQIELHNGSATSLPGALVFLTTNSLGNSTERVLITGDWSPSTIYINEAHVEPYNDNSYRLGSATYRWSDIYAVNTHWGDLGFIETTCPKCNKKFKIGDNIILKVIRFSEEDGGIMTIPIHLECTKFPTKTIKRKYPVKERYYEWDEKQGKVIVKWRTKKQKKKTKKKKLKSGYKVNKKTGRIEAINRKNIDLSEAIEEVEEEIEEIVYKEKEIKI